MTTPPPSIRPADWARMSWHQRQKLTGHVIPEPEPAPPPPEPTPEQRQAIRTIVHAIHQALLDNLHETRNAA